MRPVITLVTLGVKDVAAATRFYRALGFQPSSESAPLCSFFDLGGLVLALFDRAAMAEDMSWHGSLPAPGASSLAQNCPDRAAVDGVLAEAAEAGARIVQPARETAWGGYAGHFADPDGHVWEIAHNPFWPLDAAGRILLPA